ncbi:glucarate dehydratase family protein [Kribbella sp. VKM Ac-2566]|uniref:glucarate dehydratase family protein n=1 Tax=Kribbella sp. VKM Ac-2566 TaxID=2512218 RepID=UPI001062C1E0|nr:glucarate dehydratase family protein [Kribbella sp. VKM Ac-2566]TDW83403.1 glucarate dehydratase [Kribbella sp. VKM Ac-2566]
MSKIARVELTPVAFADPPLLNVVGVHEPFALRTIVQVWTDDGLVGLGETYAADDHLAGLRAVADVLPGLDIFDVNGLRQRVNDVLTSGGGAQVGGMLNLQDPVDVVLSPYEVALLDLQGKQLGLPVVDLLGGVVRDEVPFSAYLFYKWAAHPGGEADAWGEALDPDGIVRQAAKMIGEYGFTAIKLKGGVFPPAQEAEAVRALAEAFPEHKLRIDPNCAWTVDTSVQVARELSGVLEYLEDPTPGIDGMAAVARQTEIPLATNMCVIAFAHLRPAVLADAVQVVLSDHHYWGGLRRSQLLAGICDTFGMGLSMHSNSHLGISLAAMTHLAAATPNLTYACDTHYPWKTEDVIKPGVLAFESGSVRVPRGQGLGVELDVEVLGALHEQYLACGIRKRDDTTYMRTVDPGFSPHTARW